MRYCELLPERRAPNGVIYAISSRDYRSGQMDLTLTARIGGETVGSIDYSDFQGSPSIQMIKADPKWRRQGIASAMLGRLQREYPDHEIDWGSLTADGAKLYRSVPFEEHLDPTYVELSDRLAKVKAELAGLEAHAISISERPSDESSAWIRGVTDHWNDLHDEETQIEERLRFLRPSKRLIKDEPI